MTETGEPGSTSAPAVTIRALLFTDIEGSTRLVQRLGPSFAGVLERHHEIIRGAVSRWAGVEQSREGDGLFVTFPSASAALGAAVQAQHGVEREPWPLEGRVRVRMGMHVGEVAETGAGLVGLAIHEAARIASAAHGGQILASGDAVAHVGSLPTGAVWRPLGPHDLRDIGRLALYQLEHPGLQSDFPPLRTKRAGVHNLPASLSALVGRSNEARTVSELIDAHRVVTLVGEGGSGKTRLALRVAAAALDRFVDGVWFVDLTPLAVGADVTSRVAQVLGVPDGVGELGSALSDRQTLIVLDNCEQVVESVASLLEGLLPRSPELHVLATSRSSLGLPGEALFRVPPLALPLRDAALSEAVESEAVQLFVARAALVRTGYRLAERDVPAVVDLCLRLEGLPLALELAAARMRSMSIDELRAEVSDRVSMLSAASPSGPPRHRTLQAAVDWSFRLLDRAEQDVLCRMSAFRGGGNAASVRFVCAGGVVPSHEVLDVLARLVDKSLVLAVDRDGATRYGLHEIVREFAHASLSGRDSEASFERHARWFASVASRLALGPEPGGDTAWIRWYDDETDNLRAAADWLADHDPTAALRLGLDVAEGTSFTLWSSWPVDLMRRMLPLTDGAPAAARADALARLAWEALGTFSTDADRLVTEAIEALQGVDDPVAHASVQMSVARARGQRPGARLHSSDLDAAVGAADRVGGPYWPWLARHDLSERAEPDLAEALNLEALDIAERHGFALFAALARLNLASAAQFRGDSAVALARSRELLPVLDELVTYALDYFDLFSLIEGEHGRLDVGLHLAEDLAVRLTARPHEAWVSAGAYSSLAHLRRLAGDRPGSEAAVERAIRGFGGETKGFVGTLASITRSALWRAAGRPDRSAGVMRGTCDAGWFHGSTDIEMRVGEELAAVALALGRRQDAADLLATAEDTRRLDRKPLSPACRPEVAALTAQLHELRGRPLTQSAVRALAHSLAVSPASKATRVW
jgi:predicted ATPase/class 3 adenylate cyclase